MTGPFRLPPESSARFGTAIDRTEPLGFRLGGRALTGLYGDTLASALLANGLATLMDSPLLGRPRGLMALGLEDVTPFALEGDRGPFAFVSGDEIVLREGLRARAAGGRLAGAIRRFSPPVGADRRALPAAQQVLERLRRAVPLPGPRLPSVEASPFARRQTCDALVIGAGLAGLAAAGALRAAGLHVRVVEASRRAGGTADLYSGSIDGRRLSDWAKERADELRDRDALSFGAAAIAIGPDNTVTVVDRPDPQRPGRIELRLISAGSIVLATGFRERPLVFPGNDRPGVTLAGAARALLRRHAVAPGARVLIATTTDEGYRAAIDLKDAGVEVALVLDERPDPQGSAVDMAKALGAPISLSTVVTGIDHEPRRGAALGVRTQNRYGEGATTGARVFEADALIVSGGFSPRGELAAGVLDLEQGVYAAHVGPNAADAIAGGWAAGAAAALGLGVPAPGEAPEVDATSDEFGEPAAFSRLSFAMPGSASAFVDIGADVTLADLARAVERRGAAPAAIARRLGLGLGVDGGRLSAGLPGEALAALIGTTETAHRPIAGRITLGLMAERAELGDG